MTSTTLDIGVEPQTIVVTRTEVERTGIGKNNKPYTLYRVYATDVNGTDIKDVLKSFDPLPVGPVTVTQKAYVKDNVIRHYTLEDVNRKRTAKPGTTDTRVAELEARVDMLERKLNAFIKAFPELES